MYLTSAVCFFFFQNTCVMQMHNHSISYVSLQMENSKVYLFREPCETNSAGCIARAVGVHLPCQSQFRFLLGWLSTWFILILVIFKWDCYLQDLKEFLEFVQYLIFVNVMVFMGMSDHFLKM